VRLFRFVEAARLGASDFVQPKRGPLELLGVDAGRLAVLSNQELAVFDLNNGKRLWTTETPASARRPSDRYTACRTPQQLMLLQFAGELAQFDGATGKRTVIAPGGADRPSHLDGSGTGEWVFARGSKSEFLRSGVSIWKSEQSTPITVGPVLTPRHVVLGDAGGTLVVRDRTDGALTWKRDGLGRLQGSPVAAGDSLVVFANDIETVVALKVATGADAWRRTVGDVLLQAPIATAERVLVVTKSNRLLLLDAANGSILAERQWPTWLVRVTRIDTSPQAGWVCTDIAGAVTLLSLQELKTQHAFELSAELTGPVVYVESLAPQWPRQPARSRGEQEDLVREIQQGTPKKGPTLLAADNQGFVYFLPLSKPE
jgi:outer membrane protein assembly factor BamB